MHSQDLVIYVDDVVGLNALQWDARETWGHRGYGAMERMGDTKDVAGMWDVGDKGGMGHLGAREIWGYRKHAGYE